MSMPDRARIDRALRAARRRKRTKPTEESLQAASMLPNFTPEAAPASSGSESTTKGEGPGHPFRGNQYVRGRRGGSGGGLSISHSKLAAPDQAASGSAEWNRFNDRKRALVTLQAQTKTSRAFQFVDGKPVPVTVGTRERPISAIRAGHSLLDDENLVRRVRDVQGSGNIQTIRLDPIPARPSGGIASITGPRSMMVRRVVTKKPYIGSDRSPLPEPKRFGGDLIAAGIELVSRKSTYAVTKSVDEKRFTFGPLYIPDVLDAHSEYVTAEDLQKALWGFVEKTGSDRTIFLQHTDKPAGRWVEACTWPTEVQVELALPHAVRKAGEPTTRTVHLPPGTTFLGVIWEPWAWELVKKGQLRGYSLGGKARKERVEVGLERAANLTKDLTTITTPSGTQIRVPSRVAKRLGDVFKGEGPGHPFRGNQYVRGKGGGKGGMSISHSSQAAGQAGYENLTPEEIARLKKNEAAAVMPTPGHPAFEGNPNDDPAITSDNLTYSSLGAEDAYQQALFMAVKTGGKDGAPMSMAERRELGIESPAAIHAKAKELSALDDKIASLPDTEKLMATDPKFKAERAALHAQLIREYDDAMAGVTTRGDMLIMGGPGGVGKTSALKQYPDRFGVDGMVSPMEGQMRGSHLVLNPDLLKARLSEGLEARYPGIPKHALAALVHEESSTLSKRIAARAEASGVSIIHDITMAWNSNKDGDSVRTRIQSGKDAGYAVRGSVIGTPLRASHRNAVVRALRPGSDQRHIPWIFQRSALVNRGAQIPREQMHRASAAAQAAESGRLGNVQTWRALQQEFSPNSPGAYWNPGAQPYPPVIQPVVKSKAKI